MDDYEILKFSALFHDIGKFYQRADNMGLDNSLKDSKYKSLTTIHYDAFGAHSIWSADFVKRYFNESIEDLVLHHHEPEKSFNVDLCEILQEADNHSLKEGTYTDADSEILETPLVSIFSKVCISNEIPKEHYVPLTELDFRKSLHPRDQKKDAIEGENLLKQYKNLWENFVTEFKKMNKLDFETCLAIIKKYASTMPSSAFKSESDISLYDHLKTTVAIANCRYLYSEENDLLHDDSQQVYRIINGDISGIQNFIYRIHSPEDAQKGMSKRLRGRSLYLTLLCESICDKIIQDLSLDSSNILFCGGGRFTIIAPNTIKTENILKDVNSKINDFFINKFNAELYLALVSTPVNGSDLGKFGEILKKLGLLLDLNKKHKFNDKLKKIFEVNDDCNYDLCIVCGNETFNEDKICNECKSHELLGQKVTNSKYVLKYYSDKKINNSDFFNEILTIGFSFKKDKKSVIKTINENPTLKFNVYKLNDTNFMDLTEEITNDKVSFDFKVLANTIPAIGDDALYFEHLATLSKGANKLGILKMDVDNLGKIFANGFDYLDDKNQSSSISHLSSLSFYMDLFFSGRINQIVSKFNFFEEIDEDNNSFYKKELIFEDRGCTEIKNVFKPKKDLPKDYQDLGTSTIHINYSGGDDLLVVGPYDDIIEFAQEFRRRFKKWTANNESINISAGLLFVNSKFPIGKAAILADVELEKSKSLGKNKISLFNETVNWDTNFDIIQGFDEIFKFSKFLEGKCEENEISRSFVHSLLNIWELNYKHNYISNNEEWVAEMNGRLNNRDFIPYFKYKLRLIKDKKLRDEIDKKGFKFMPWIKIPVSWVSLRLR